MSSALVVVLDTSVWMGDLHDVRLSRLDRVPGAPSGVVRFQPGDSGLT
jgi:hypothetical protein